MGPTGRAVAEALRGMAVAASSLAKHIAAPHLSGRHGVAAGGSNVDGDAQRRLDLVAEEVFSAALRSAQIGAYLSEEVATPSLFDPESPIAVAIDPLDGSSNIDVNSPIGTIFSILPMVPAAREDPALAFRQTGRAQLAAGFFTYGPQTSLTLTLGRGVHILVLDPRTGEFLTVESDIAIPKDSSEFAINASNARHWPEPVKRFIDDRLQGKEGRLGRNFNMRWVGSLVADAYRIFIRGGVFLYPGDARAGYERGRLRLLYEASPVAFLAEQAGGAATDGVTPILDLKPHSPHQRAPLVMGSAKEVESVRRHYLDHSPPNGDAASSDRPMVG
jgi:fructose-1,6-bisphosphatase I